MWGWVNKKWCFRGGAYWVCISMFFTLFSCVLYAYDDRANSFQSLRQSEVNNDNYIHSHSGAYLQYIEGMVGGRYVRSKSYYLNDECKYQVAESSNDGRLFFLKETLLKGGCLSKSLSLDVYKKRGAEQTNSEWLSEYYQPALHVSIRNSSGQRVFESYLDNEVPAALLELSKKLKNIDLESAKGERAGLYLQIEQVPWPQSRKADFSLNVSQIERDPLLRKAFEEETSFVWMAEPGKSIVVANKLVVLPNRSVYVAVNTQLYLFSAFKLK